MKDLTLHIPDTLDLDEQEATMVLASSLYASGKLSLGEAADLAHLPKRKFAELLSVYNTSVFNYPTNELARDVSNA